MAGDGRANVWAGEPAGLFRVLVADTVVLSRRSTQLSNNGCTCMKLRDMCKLRAKTGGQRSECRPLLIQLNHFIWDFMTHCIHLPQYPTIAIESAQNKQTTIRNWPLTNAVEGHVPQPFWLKWSSARCPPSSLDNQLRLAPTDMEHMTIAGIAAAKAKVLARLVVTSSLEEAWASDSDEAPFFSRPGGQVEGSHGGRGGRGHERPFRMDLRHGRIDVAPPGNFRRDDGRASSDPRGHAMLADLSLAGLYFQGCNRLLVCAGQLAGPQQHFGWRPLIPFTFTASRKSWLRSSGSR